jgi:hypothetical protein
LDIIFDIDGTLLNIQHRVYHLYKKPPDWESFNDSMGGDSPIPEMVDLLHMIGNYKKNRLIFCSGRSEHTRFMTEKQITSILSSILDKENSKTINLYLRGLNDFREDSVVKSDLYDQMLEDGFNPELIFEDRASVVKMWRARGLRCLQVAEANF